MNTKNLLRSFVLGLALLNLACDAAYSIMATKIKDILDHPRDYERKEVTVYGTVTNAVSLLVVKYYEIQDDTGSIKVLTDKLLPRRGEKLKVTGRMTVVEVGTERWVVLRENKDSNFQAVQSRNAEDGPPRSHSRGNSGGLNFSGSAKKSTSESWNMSG